MQDRKVTILTPVYNRKGLMSELFDSLMHQVSQSFIWMIVDDGSTDDMSEFVDGLKNRSTFPIEYYRKINGGKHTALNYGIQRLNTELCFIVDSDDVLPKESISTILEYYELVENKERIAGIGGLRENKETGHIIGTTFEGDTLKCKSSSRRQYAISGDKAEVFKSKILKQFPFPEFEGEKFLSESIVWNEMGNKGYEILWFNKVIYRGEYLEGGLTDSLFKNYAQSPRGFALYLKSLIQYEGVSTLRRYYYYGMYQVVANIPTITQGAQDMEINNWQMILGITTYKLVRFVKKGVR